MTDRLKFELFKLRSVNKNVDPEVLVFGGVQDPKNSFNAARKKVGLEDFQFRDLRHTTATRLIAMNRPLQEVARLLGHSDPKTTYRYVNLHQDAIEQARSALNAYNAITDKKKAIA